MPDNFKSPDPKRFEVSRATLWFDHFMGWGDPLRRDQRDHRGVRDFLLHRQGGGAACSDRPDVEPAGQVATAAVPAVLGVDEWGEMPFFYDGGDQVVFVDVANGERKELAGARTCRIESHGACLRYGPPAGVARAGGRPGGFVSRRTTSGTSTPDGKSHGRAVAHRGAVVRPDAMARDR